VIRLGADEDFKRQILRGLRRLRPDLDLVRVQDVGLSGSDDATNLEWAASEGRVLLTHDAKTMTHFAYQRVVAGFVMSGLLVVSQDMQIGQAIEEVLIVAECITEGEWEGQVRYLPL